VSFCLRVVIYGIALLVSTMGASSCGAHLPVPDCTVSIGFEEMRDGVIACRSDAVCIDETIRRFIVADCINPDDSFSELSAEMIDGASVMTPENRKVFELWLESQCKDRQGH
jgi:hypothetical protein